ncbi:MAG TPA: SsrA-binding protein SmpB [Kiritimatiellia bacterium]|jgi:SsrA-binding protein
MTEADKKPRGSGQLATNRKASHHYFILEKIEAGIELRGPEVKSIRDGRVSLDEAFADINNGEMVLRDLHIQPYKHSRVEELDPVRPRKLLLHKAEIFRLLGQIQIKGHTLVPLRLYLKQGLIKVELGLAKGKQFADKRESLKRKEHDRDVARIVASRKRGR